MDIEREEEFLDNDLSGERIINKIINISIILLIISIPAITSYFFIFSDSTQKIINNINWYNYNKKDIFSLIITVTVTLLGFILTSFSILQVSLEKQVNTTDNKLSGKSIKGTVFYNLISLFLLLILALIGLIVPIESSFRINIILLTTSFLVTLSLILLFMLIWILKKLND